jgi:hypothetical protein
MGREFIVQQAEDSGVESGPIPDDTILVATVMATKSRETTFPGETEPTERLNWKFRIDEEPYLDKYVYGDTGVKLVNHPSCKIYGWAQATLGINPLPLDYRFNEDDLWNRQVRVLVGAREGKDKKTNEDRIFNYVEDVLPVGPVATKGAFDESEPF